MTNIHADRNLIEPTPPPNPGSLGGTRVRVKLMVARIVLLLVWGGAWEVRSMFSIHSSMLTHRKLGLLSRMESCIT